MKIVQVYPHHPLDGAGIARRWLTARGAKAKERHEALRGQGKTRAEQMTGVPEFRTRMRLCRVKAPMRPRDGCGRPWQHLCRTQRPWRHRMPP